jgi:hypothetical protein
MNTDNIIIYFSIFVIVCVVVWALFMINEFNKVNKN